MFSAVMFVPLPIFALIFEITVLMAHAPLKFNTAALKLSALELNFDVCLASIITESIFVPVTLLPMVAVVVEVVVVAASAALRPTFITPPEPDSASA